MHNASGRLGALVIPRPLRALPTLLLLVALAVASLAMLPPASPAWAAQQGEAWSVSTVDGELGEGRPNFEYALGPGETVTDAMLVKNTGTEPLRLRIYAADAFTTSSGAIDILKAGEPSLDAGLWTEPATEFIEIAPGESEEVPFTIAVPDGALPGDHSAAIVASLLEEQDGSQVQVERRLGLRISIRVPGEMTADVALEAVDAAYAATWNPFDPGRVQVTYQLTNNGNTRVNVLDDLRVSGLLGMFPGAVIGTDVTDLLPGSSVQVVREVPTAAIGPVSGELTIVNTPLDDAVPAPEQLQSEVSVFALPWALIALILLVLAAVAVVVVIWIRRRRMAQWIAYSRRKEAAGEGGTLTEEDAAGRAGARDGADARTDADGPSEADGTSRSEAGNGLPASRGEG